LTNNSQLHTNDKSAQILREDLNGTRRSLECMKKQSEAQLAQIAHLKQEQQERYSESQKINGQNPQKLTNDVLMSGLDSRIERLRTRIAKMEGRADSSQECVQNIITAINRCQTVNRKLAAHILSMECAKNSNSGCINSLGENLKENAFDRFEFQEKLADVHQIRMNNEIELLKQEIESQKSLVAQLKQEKIKLEENLQCKDELVTVLKARSLENDACGNEEVCS